MTKDARPRELLTTKQVCDMLQVHPKTLLKFVHAGKLHRIELADRIVRYDKKEVNAFIYQEKR